MKTIIVDDDPNAQEFLAELLTNHCPQLVLAGIGNNIIEGKQLIEQLRPELVFLDVEMPHGTGFDLLQQLPTVNFKVIFTTAHEKYALRAIKYSTLDYLLKPVDTEDLLQAVDKALQNEQQKEQELKINTLLQNIRQGPVQDQKIVLKDQYGMYIISLKDIIHLKAENNYTTFFIDNHAPILISKSLKECDALLPPDYFFRCHKSHLVNLNYLLRFDRKHGDMLLLKDGSEVPISRRKSEVLLNLIKEM